jgi:hypothetical protein
MRIFGLGLKIGLLIDQYSKTLKHIYLRPGLAFNFSFPFFNVFVLFVQVQAL